MAESGSTSRLVDRARERTALDVFEVDDVDAAGIRLERLLAAPEVSPEHRARAEQQAIQVLSAHLQFVADERQYPDILRESVDAPVFVVGYARAGTTLTQCLLGADPDHRMPLAWEVYEPSPRAKGAGPGQDRLKRADAAVADFLDALPGFIAQHPYWDQGGRAPMECEGFEVVALRSSYPVFVSALPTGFTFAQPYDDAGFFEFHRRMLQHLQFGDNSRRWVVKGTFHMKKMSALLAEYPDARVVWAHRDLVQVYGSWLKVMFMLQDGMRRNLGQPPIDPVELGRMLIEREQRTLRAVVEDEFAKPSANVYHLRFTDLMADPVNALARAYDHFGMRQTSGARAGITEFLADPANDPGRHGRWAYDIADYGLDPLTVRKQFDWYYDRFGL